MSAYQLPMTVCQTCFHLYNPSKTASHDIPINVRNTDNPSSTPTRHKSPPSTPIPSTPPPTRAHHGLGQILRLHRRLHPRRPPLGLRHPCPPPMDSMGWSHRPNPPPPLYNPNNPRRHLHRGQRHLFNIRRRRPTPHRPWPQLLQHRAIRAPAYHGAV